MDGLLQNKTAVVTGANRGIGRAIVETFAAHGASIFACARKKTDSFVRDMQQIETQYGVKIFPIFFDFEIREEMVTAVKEIRSYKIPLDILVNNAGILSDCQRFLMIPMDKVKKLFDVDYFAQMEFTQLIARLMQRNKKGSIIYISSIASLDAFFSSYDYAACKAAINISMCQQARELGEQGIRVNAVAPGVIETEMIQNVDQASKQDLLPAIQLCRYGNKQDVANAVLFMASDLAGYITGQILRVDGGITPPRATW